MLSALMNQENGIVPALMDEMGVGKAPIQLALQREFKNLPKISGNVNTARSYASSALTEAVEKAQEISREMEDDYVSTCLLYTSPSPRDRQKSRMPSSA